MSKPVLKNIDLLTPYENNSRIHSDAQIDQLANSISEFGYVGAIVIRDGVIAKGHGCLVAIKWLLDKGEKIYPAPGKSGGAKAYPVNKIPTIDATGWSDAQFKAYVITDNKLALNADWDMDMLRIELDDLKLDDFNLDFIGFDSSELADIFASGNEGKTDEDDIPDAPERARSKPGDVWILGKHRIVCGDSTNAETVALCLGKVKPHLMVTDPPYGVEYDANWRNTSLRENGKPIGARAIGKVDNDSNADWSAAWALFPGEVIYIWHASMKTHVFAESIKKSGFELRAHIIWVKNNIAIGRGHYHWQHEPCWYAVRKSATGHWQGSRKESTVWNIDKPMKSETGHSTQKPVECMRRPIENNSKPGEAIYGPFCGSGTTIIAAETTARVCHAIEINPLYVDMAIIRWQDFTGEQVINEHTGATFNSTRYRKAA